MEKGTSLGHTLSADYGGSGARVVECRGEEMERKWSVVEKKWRKDPR